MDIANIASVKVEVSPGVAVPQTSVAPVDFEALLAAFQAPVKQEPPTPLVTVAITAPPMIAAKNGTDEIQPPPEIGEQPSVEPPKTALPETDNAGVALTPVAPFAAPVPDKNITAEPLAAPQKSTQTQTTAGLTPTTTPDVITQKTGAPVEPATFSHIQSNKPLEAVPPPEALKLALASAQSPEEPKPLAKVILPFTSPPVRAGFAPVDRPEPFATASSQAGQAEMIQPKGSPATPQRNPPMPSQIAKVEQTLPAPMVNTVDLDNFLIRPAEQNMRLDTIHRTGPPEITVEAARIKTPVAEILAQIVNKLSSRGEQRIELRLDPPELGRVIVNLSPTENSVTATVTVERPEILDLMRRHADLLAAALESAGYASANLEFQSGSGGDDNTDSPDDQNPAHTAIIPPDASQPSGIIIENGRLDIRL